MTSRPISWTSDDRAGLLECSATSTCLSSRFSSQKFEIFLSNDRKNTTGRSQLDNHLLRPSTTIFDTLTMWTYCCSMWTEFVYTKAIQTKKPQVSSLLRNGVTPWRAPPPPQTVDDDFGHLNDVDVLLHHVDWVRLYLSYPDHPKKPEKNRLCNPPPILTTVPYKNHISLDNGLVHSKKTGMINWLVVE